MPEKESQRESACACVREREAGRETDRERSACAHTHRESGVRGHLVLTLGRGILHVQLQRTRPWICKDHEKINRSWVSASVYERARERAVGALSAARVRLRVRVCVCAKRETEERDLVDLEKSYQ